LAPGLPHTGLCQIENGRLTRRSSSCRRIGYLALASVASRCFRPPCNAPIPVNRTAQQGNKFGPGRLGDGGSDVLLRESADGTALVAVDDFDLPDIGRSSSTVFLSRTKSSISMPISPSAPISSISLAFELRRGSSSNSPSTFLTSMQLFALVDRPLETLRCRCGWGGISPNSGGCS
jgi:hypothetical protein